MLSHSWGWPCSREICCPFGRRWWRMASYKAWLEKWERCNLSLRVKLRHPKNHWVMPQASLNKPMLRRPWIYLEYLQLWLDLLGDWDHVQKSNFGSAVVQTMWPKRRRSALRPIGIMILAPKPGLLANGADMVRTAHCQEHQPPGSFVILMSNPLISRVTVWPRHKFSLGQLNVLAICCDILEGQFQTWATVMN